MKILSIDPGLKRVGLAACDELGLSTRLIPPLIYKSRGALIQRLMEIIEGEKFPCVLVGHPLNMDGSSGAAAKRSEKMVQDLRQKIQQKNLDCQVQLWDERLSTFEAKTRLREQGVKLKKGRARLDSMAAQVILEDYLGAQA